MIAFLLLLLLLFLLEDFQYLSSISNLSTIRGLHSDPEFNMAILWINPTTSLLINCAFLYLTNTRLHRSGKKKLPSYIVEYTNLCKYKTPNWPPQRKIFFERDITQKRYITAVVRWHNVNLSSAALFSRRLLWPWLNCAIYKKDDKSRHNFLWSTSKTNVPSNHESRHSIVDHRPLKYQVNLKKLRPAVERSEATRGNVWVDKGMMKTSTIDPCKGTPSM